jgi:hypothetical protein
MYLGHLELHLSEEFEWYLCGILDLYVGDDISGTPLPRALNLSKTRLRLILLCTSLRG